jgi:hypothetical protein
MRGRCLSVVVSVAASALACAAASAASLQMHHVWLAGKCDPGIVETIDVPIGVISLSQHIKGWSPANQAGRPRWISFNRWESDNQIWAGFGPNMNFGPPWMSAISSDFSPDPPVNGGVVDYVEQDKVLTPVRMQVEIESVHWYSGDGSCAQAPMEMWVSIGTGGTAAAPLGGMNETASSPTTPTAPPTPKATAAPPPTPPTTPTTTPNGGATGWTYQGIGDCLGHDVGRSQTSAPDPAMCKPGVDTAVCWDAKQYVNKGDNTVWCTYKNVTVQQCNANSPNPARMYSCQNGTIPTAPATPTAPPTPKAIVTPPPTPPATPPATPTAAKACPDNPPAMELQTCHIVAKAGAAIDVPIYLLKSADLADLNFEIHYDGAVIRAAGKAKAGPLLNASAIFDANPNEVGVERLGFAAKAGVAGSGILATVPFTVVGAPGSRTTLDVNYTEANGASGAAEKLLLAPGDLVVETPPPAFTALDAMKALQMSIGLLTPDVKYDLDKDGQITANDARLILQQVVAQ